MWYTSQLSTTYGTVSWLAFFVISDLTSKSSCFKVYKAHSSICDTHTGCQWTINRPVCCTEVWELLCQRGISHSMVPIPLWLWTAHARFWMQPRLSSLTRRLFYSSLSSIRGLNVRWTLPVTPSPAENKLLMKCTIELLRGFALTGQHATGLSQMANASQLMSTNQLLVCH